jgi:hypothetical protein
VGTSAKLPSVVASEVSWPSWRGWELDCSNPHLAKRMLDRSFSETDLRDMLERASSFRPDAVLGRFIVETVHADARWEVIVEPDAAAEILIVVTAYAVT